MTAGTLLTDVEAAEFFRVTRNTIWRWAKEIPTFPQPVRITPATPRWRRSDLEAYIAEKASGAK